MLHDACASNPCYLVSCTEAKVSPGYICGECPQGTEGNGVNCRDIDEVQILHNSERFIIFLSRSSSHLCSSYVHCQNLNIFSTGG